ncbi:hypothetical protein [uncultured Caulobacter sp.]|jgi:hypothetical protein|uniref:hypothetical protein n=1 Tax=uncultured Caulobacter sp. TaxID=158749 RepID=UPI00261600C4|nr:hypothetical protein [uncultured Caulobacter sp.]
MPIAVWFSVFANAAAPQRILIVAMLAAVPAILVALALAWRAPKGPWRRVIADIGVTAAGLGVLIGATESFHMARTILRLPFDATLKQLAPGILEVSTLVGLGISVGLFAFVAYRLAQGFARESAQA